MDENDTYSYVLLLLTIIGFVIFLAFYILFLYIPTVEFEDEFNSIADQADGILRDALETSNQIEELNKTVEDGFTSFCVAYNAPPKFIFPNPLHYAFGKTYVVMCEGIN